jgi:hypothetical protein
MPLTPNEYNVIIEISCKPNPCNQIDEMTLSLSSGSNVAFREVLEINSFFPFSDFTTGPIFIGHPEKYMILVEPEITRSNAPSIVLRVKKMPHHPVLFCLRSAMDSVCYHFYFY